MKLTCETAPVFDVYSDSARLGRGVRPTPHPPPSLSRRVRTAWPRPARTIYNRYMYTRTQCESRARCSARPLVRVQSSKALCSMRQRCGSVPAPSWAPWCTSQWCRRADDAVVSSLVTEGSPPALPLPGHTRCRGAGCPEGGVRLFFGPYPRRFSRGPRVGRPPGRHPRRAPHMKRVVVSWVQGALPPRHQWPRSSPRRRSLRPHPPPPDGRPRGDAPPPWHKP